MININPVFIIAEAGVNHNGDIKLATQLVEVAAKAGVNAVKFQTFIPEALVTDIASKAEYQKQTTDAKESQLLMLQKLSLSFQDHEILLKHCEKFKIKFLSSAFDLKSIDFLETLNISIYKIPSGEITNLPYLRKIASKGKSVIISTGMATLGEVEAALNVLIDEGLKRSQITVLHCTTEYPTPFDQVNLRAMITLGNSFGCAFGYSDHTSGSEVSIAAVAMGATVIEKHFTLNKDMSGPDHKASLEPSELSELVRKIRNVSKALGNGIKKPSNSELNNISVVRKVIVAATNISNGEILTEANITCKRASSDGISPMLWDEIIGRRARREFRLNEVIEI